MDNPVLLTSDAAENKYVALLDLLGFSAQVLEDFARTTEMYQRILNDTRTRAVLNPGVKLVIYSDSIMITADHLADVIKVVNMMQFHTLFHDYLVRGGIGYGRHVEAQEAGNFYVVSEALVKATMAEKTTRMPCVVIHKEIEIPNDWWQFRGNPFLRAVLHVDGMNIVSPFNIIWGTSAAQRVRNFCANYSREDFPAHHEKFEWFLSLYNSLYENRPITPPSFSNPN